MLWTSRRTVTGCLPRVAGARRYERHLPIIRRRVVGHDPDGPVGAVGDYALLDDPTFEQRVQPRRVVRAFERILGRTTERNREDEQTTRFQELPDSLENLAVGIVICWRFAVGAPSDMLDRGQADDSVEPIIRLPVLDRPDDDSQVRVLERVGAEVD